MSIGLHYFDQEKSKRKRLFHAVILQSNPLGYKYRNIVVANFIGESYKQLLDCEDIRCLQSEPVDEIIYVQDTLQAAPRSIGDFFTWGPVLTDQHYSREVRLRPGMIIPFHSSVFFSFVFIICYLFLFFCFFASLTMSANSRIKLSISTKINRSCVQHLRVSTNQGHARPPATRCTCHNRYKLP